MHLRFILPVFISIFLTFSSEAFAIEKTVCVILNDIDPDVAKIVADMDQDNRYITHLYQDSYHNDKLTSRVELSPADLKVGLILNRKDKYIIVRMHSDNYDPDQGGVLYLDTLYSGISGERKEYEFDLVMDKSGPILIHDKSPFGKMKFIAKRSKVFGVIGVERVEFGEK